MEIPQNEGLFEPYFKQLSLSWRIKSAFGPVDRPQIVSAKETQEHRITLPYAHAQRMEEYRCDYVHELVHAKFAETLDPIFSAVYFDPVYDMNDPAFREQAYMVYYSQQLIDTWVSDYMGKMDRKLPEEDISTWLDSMLMIPGAQFRDMRLEVVMGYALNQAEIARTGLKGFNRKQEKALSKIRTFLGKDDARLALQLGQLYQELPELPTDKAQAIKLFEEKTQQATEILGFPIKPSIIEKDGSYYWSIEQRETPETK